MDCRSTTRSLVVMLICLTVVYLRCVYKQATLVSRLSDFLIGLLCSIAILGFLFPTMNFYVSVDPLVWLIFQDTANSTFAYLAKNIGAAGTFFRVTATWDDRRLFLKAIAFLYVFSTLGRLVSGFTIAYAGLCIFCIYVMVEKSRLISAVVSVPKESKVPMI